MENKDAHLMPEGSKWRVTDQLVKVPTPFNLATETMPGEKYQTIRMITHLQNLLVIVDIKQRL